MAIGNHVSMQWPFRTAGTGRRTRSISAGQGCAFGFVSIGFTAAAGALAIPSLLALLAPAYWVPPTWYAAAIPLALAYALGIYFLSLKWAEKRLMRKEWDIVERLAPAE